MAKEYIFVRHGKSIVNETRTISNRNSDYAPLTVLGREQAKQLLDTIRYHRIIAIYSSPLMRARETAEILAAGLGRKVEIADALREPDCGEIDGRSDDEAWKVHAAQEEVWRAGKHDHRIPGGESFLDVQARFIPFVNHILSKHKEDTGSVLVVSHGSVLINMLPLVLSNIPPDFARANLLGNCSYVVATSTKRGLACTEWYGKQIGSQHAPSMGKT